MPKPLWSYIFIAFTGVTLFVGAMFFLVMTVRTTGLVQWYWAFNAVLLISILALSLTAFAVERK